MRSRLQIGLSVFLLLGTLLFLHFRSSGEAVPIRKPLGDFPPIMGDWRLQEVSPLDDRTLAILKLSDYTSRRYVDSNGRSVSLYIGYWQTQRKGAQIHSPKHCLPGSGWEPIQASKAIIALPAPYGSIETNRTLIQKDRQRQLVLYWYQSQGKTSAGEVGARIQMVRNSILHNRSDGSIIRITSPVFGTVSETSESLTAFVQAMFPVLNEFLPD